MNEMGSPSPYSSIRVQSGQTACFRKIHFWTLLLGANLHRTNMFVHVVPMPSATSQPQPRSNRSGPEANPNPVSIELSFSSILQRQRRAPLNRPPPRPATTYKTGSCLRHNRVFYILKSRAETWGAHLPRPRGTTTNSYPDLRDSARMGGV
jgi:hypothetical protein